MLNSNLQINDQHEIRAIELEKMGYNRIAHQIRTCGQRQHFKSYPHIATCKNRLCPSCSQTIADNNYHKVRSIVSSFENPRTYLVTMPKMYNLSIALSIFRKSFAKLRNLAEIKRNVKGGISALEIKYDYAEYKWDVHCHLILDTNGFNIDYIKKKWREYTKLKGKNWTGQFEHHKNPMLNKSKMNGFITYITKPDTWCPQPSVSESSIDLNSLRMLEKILEAMKYRKLLIAWGTGYRKQRK